MQSPPVKRIIAQTGMPRLPVALAEELSASDLQSLLLSVYRHRGHAAQEAHVLSQAKRNVLLKPSSIDARILSTFDHIAFATAAGFEAIDLSPVCPLGTTHVLGGIDQNNVLTTIRNAEVLGDSTVALALECAQRRRSAAERTRLSTERLCTTHRVVRLQPFDFPGYSPHFRLFSLISAGRDAGSSMFETAELTEHIRSYLDLCRALNSKGFALQTPLVEISDVTITERLLNESGVSRQEIRSGVRAHIPGSSERFLSDRGISLPADVVDPATELRELAERFEGAPGVSRLLTLKSRVVDPLQAAYPEAIFRFNLKRLEGLGYYTGICLRISPVAPDGIRYPIIDGGFTDWTARLLQDRKERLLTSGIGTEFVCRRYRTLN